MTSWDSELGELVQFIPTPQIRKKGNEQRPPGRPARNPFTNCPDVETVLYAKALHVVKRCYQPSADNIKKPFLLQPQGYPAIRMGCTAFWAFIFIYYREKYGIRNLEYFVDNLKLHLPDIKMVGDRTSIQKNICKFDCQYVHLSPSTFDYTKNADEVLYKRFRTAYLYAISVWEEA